MFGELNASGERRWVTCKDITNPGYILRWKTINQVEDVGVALSILHGAGEEGFKWESNKYFCFVILRFLSSHKNLFVLGIICGEVNAITGCKILNFSCF